MKFAKSLAASAVCLGAFLALSGPAAASIVFEVQDIMGAPGGLTTCDDTYCLVDINADITTSYGQGYNITIKMPAPIQHLEVPYWTTRSVDWYATKLDGKVVWVGGFGQDGGGDVPLTIHGDVATGFYRDIFTGSDVYDGCDTVIGPEYTSCETREERTSQLGSYAGGDIFGTVDPSAVGKPYTIIISTVPEPVTWALMLLGVAGLGAALRRRRQDQPAAAGA